LYPLTGILAATDFITGNPPFGGGASIEVNFIDSSTDRLLATGVEKRFSGKTLRGWSTAGMK